MSDDALAWLRLARSRNVGPQTFPRLIERFGSAERALEALPSLAAKGGERAYQPCSERQGREEMARAEAAGAVMLRLFEEDYPAPLAEIADPPPFLWALGEIALAHRPAIAVIGARNASTLGRRMAGMLAEGLSAAGFVVVSGFARGIDAAAHAAALEGAGTVAAMAGGADVIYPEQNAALAARMREGGGLFLSEAPMGMQPLARHFPRRNRIVSGLSAATVLIEAAARSGSLITARMALEQGREVMAVPGSPLDPRAEGCNGLIRQGAALIRSAEDVLEALEGPRRLLSTARDRPAPPALPEPEPEGDLAARLFELIGPSAVDLDALSRDLGAAPSALAAALLELELAGRVERLSGGMVARAAE